MVRTLRKLNKDEENQVLNQHGHICFATGHTIPDGEQIEFDHIKAFASGGPTVINNIAPMCRDHNRKKGRHSLYDFHIKMKLDSFFSRGDRLTLHDLLEYLQNNSHIDSFGLPVSVQVNQDKITISSAESVENYQIHQCSVTGWSYFYANLPVALIDSDDDREQLIGLQPRFLIADKVFSLFQHFQRHPVLQPSLGRIVGNKIRLFDGQHKAAALLWNNRKIIECKIYVDPDVRLLNQTNISAHDNFSQTRFYSSIMVMKLGTQFRKDFDEYKNIEDGRIKTEKGFVDYIRTKDGLTAAQANRRFQSFLYNAINLDESNNLSRLISVTNRASAERPISNNALANSIYASCLYRSPSEHDMTTDAYLRDVEIENIIKLLNVIDETALIQWDPKAAKDDITRVKLERFLRSRFMKAWSELVSDAIFVKLNLIDQDEKKRLFYRSLSKDNEENIRRIIQRLVGWKMWEAPVGGEIDQVRSDTDKAVKDWVRNKGLTATYLLGLSE